MNKISILNKIKTRNKILINCGSKESSQKLNKLVNDSNCGLLSTNPSKHSPRMIIFGIDSTLSKSDFTDCLINQNDKFRLMIENQNETFEILFMKKDRNGQQFAILKVTPKLWKLCIDEKRIFIGYNACHIQNYISITQCYRCLRFGHKSVDCSNNLTCNKCGGHDHYGSNCKKTYTSCVNCLFKNSLEKSSNWIDTNHNALSKSCPTYCVLLNEMAKRINYEG